MPFPCLALFDSVANALTSLAYAYIVAFEGKKSFVVFAVVSLFPYYCE